MSTGTLSLPPSATGEVAPAALRVTGAGCAHLRQRVRSLLTHPQQTRHLRRLLRSKWDWIAGTPAGILCLPYFPDSGNLLCMPRF